VYEQIRSLGADLVAISPQLPKYSKQIVKKHNLAFPILTDFDNSVATSFGLTFSLSEELKAVYMELGIDLPRFNGNDSWQLPMAGRFIANSQGIIRNVEAHPDYTRRPEPTAIVEYLQSAASSGVEDEKWYFK
jgi:peroxiredoxin